MITRIFTLILLTLGLKAQKPAENATPVDVTSIYDFKVKDIQGNEFDFSTLKGKKMMIINTASRCGFTHQYEDLQKLYEKYQDKGFTIVAFPANNFMMQESGSNKSIAEFCSTTFGVTFPLMSKISVKGSDMAPIYRFLTQKSQNGVMDSQVKWNFQKYLIDENGTLVKIYESKVSPSNPEIVDWIEGK